MYHDFISSNAARRIVKLDNPNMETREVKLNIPQVYCACNVWLNIVCSTTHDVGVTQRIRDMLYQLGLVKVMKACKSVSQDLLSQTLECSGDTLWDFSKKYIPLRDATHEIAFLVDICRQTYSGVQCMEKVLQCLLFLARFTYISSNVSNEVYQKFFAANDQCKRLTYDWSARPGQATLDFVKGEMSKIFTPRYFHYDFRDGGFSNGSLRDGLRHPTEKWKALAQFESCYKGCIQYPWPWHRAAKIPSENIPYLMAVPKSFDERRIIAPEGPIVNYYGKAFLEALRRMLKANRSYGYINEDNQSINRLLAKEGSITGEWCTIDMSSASDTITRQLFLECIPPAMASIYRRFMSTYMEWAPMDHRAHSYRQLFMAFTSGNPVTWITEAGWFLGLGRAAAAIAQDPNPNKSVFAFGDDLIVKVDNYETTIDLLKSMGHTVNEAKSYGCGLFRESCGGWYYHGHDVTPIYWPRRPVQPTELVWTVCDLQHKLFDCDEVSSWLEHYALQLNPKMTYSPKGDECDDLWVDTLVAKGYLDLGRHLYRKVRRDTVKPDAFTEHLAYYMYLEFGPMYESALDELLHVSSSRLEALCTVTCEG